MTATQDRLDDPIIIPDPIILSPRTVPVVPSQPAKAPRKRGPGRIAFGILLWFVVGFGVWCLLLSALPAARQQRSLAEEFGSLASQGLAPVNQPIAPGAAIARMQIPVIGMDTTVVEGSEPRQTVAGPGHLRTSALPGQTGVSVILGRRVTQGASFRNIADLRKGDRIKVTNGQGTWNYRVTRTRSVPADDASAFLATGDALLLVTSERTAASSGRFVVTAKATKELAPRGTGTLKGPVTAAELGLQGDSTAATGMLVWTQVLVLVAAGAMVLHRRWGPWPTWLIAAPVLAAAVWSLYEFMGLLLPATL